MPTSLIAHVGETKVPCPGRDCRLKRQIRVRKPPTVISARRPQDWSGAEAGIEQSVGSVGDSYDNALAESIIGLYKTEVIRTRGPWRGLEPVEFATLDWVDWFNHRRILEPIREPPTGRGRSGVLSPTRTHGWPRDSHKMVSGIPGAVQKALTRAA